MKIAKIDLGKEDIYLNREDFSVLKNFSRKKHQTLADLLTSNMLRGSNTIKSLEKLVSFGFVRRDWEKEMEMDENVIYSITSEGEYFVEKEEIDF